MTLILESTHDAFLGCRMAAPISPGAKGLHFPMVCSPEAPRSSQDLIGHHPKPPAQQEVAGSEPRGLTQRGGSVSKHGTL